MNEDNFLQIVPGLYLGSLKALQTIQYHHESKLQPNDASWLKKVKKLQGEMWWHWWKSRQGQSWNMWFNKLTSRRWTALFPPHLPSITQTSHPVCYIFSVYQYLPHSLTNTCLSIKKHLNPLCLFLLSISSGQVNMAKRENEPEQGCRFRMNQSKVPGSSTNQAPQSKHSSQIMEENSNVHKMTMTTVYRILGETAMGSLN